MFSFELFERLLFNSSYPPDEQEEILDRVVLLLNSTNEFEVMELEELKQHLLSCQLDPIMYGFNYGQKEIVRHLKKLR